MADTFIPGATSSVYVPVSGDVGKQLFCRVTGTNVAGAAFADAIPTGAITSGTSAPALLTAPVIANTTPTVGGLLHTTDGTWSGAPSPTFNYEWHRVTSGTPVAPSNVTAPVIADTSPVLGEVLFTTDGSWTGDAPVTFSYQWKRGVTDVGGNSPNYTLIAADVGQNMSCVVTGQNSAGSAPATSNVVGPVLQLPANTGVPVITGTTTQGQTLSCSQGTWTGSATITYGYQWYRAMTLISGATAPTYLLVAADVAKTVFCRVTATNGAGSVPADASGVGPVAAPIPPFTYIVDGEGQNNFTIETPAMNTTGAGLLVVAIADGITDCAVSDSKGNTWTQTVGSEGVGCRLFYSYPAAVGTGHTVTVTGPPTISSAACFAAFMGGAAGSFDKESHGGAFSGTAAGGSVTPTANGSLIVSVVAIKDAGGGSSTVGGGFTKICDIPVTGTPLMYGLAVGYLIQTTTTAANPSWTLPGTGSWEAMNVVFRPS